MTLRDECLLNAAHCMQHALEARRPHISKSYREIALRWRRLADAVEGLALDQRPAPHQLH